MRHFYSLKSKLLEEIDGLDFDDKHYSRRKSDLEDRLSKAYDRIDELEELLLDARAKKRTIKAEKITGDNIYKIMFYLSGEDPCFCFCKRGIDQYPARLSGGLQSPTEINAPRGCAGIWFGRCQLTLTRIPRQFSRARIELTSP